MQRAAPSSFAIAFVSRFHAGCAWKKSLPPRDERAAHWQAARERRPTLTLRGLRREPHPNIGAARSAR
jgi:hypothetical protein